MSDELPDSYQAIYQRAIEQMSLGESQEAIDSLLRIVRRLGRLRPETLQRKPNLQQTLLASWTTLVQFLRWEERYQEAIDLTRDVMDRLPHPDTGPIRIASLTIDSGEAAQGLAALTRIAQEQDSFRAWAALGSEYRLLERYDESIEAYRNALRRASSDEEAVLANMALFSLHRSVGRVPEALDAWQMALVLDPDMADSASEVYGWLIREGYLQEAAPYLERELSPILSAFFSGLVDWQADRQEAARRKWREVLDIDREPELDSEVEALMEASLRLGEPEKVTEIARELFTSRSLLSVRADVLRGIAVVMRDEPELAQSYFEQALLRFQRTTRLRSGLATDLWELLTQLVPESERTAGLARFFNTGT